MRQQQFIVRTCCCGMELVRGFRALRDAAREERDLCRRCADVAAGRGKKIVGAGTRFGPVVVEAESQGRYWARWDCCGGVAELSSARLYVLRHEAEAGGHAGLSGLLSASQGRDPQGQDPLGPGAGGIARGHPPGGNRLAAAGGDADPFWGSGLMTFFIELFAVAVPIAGLIAVGVLIHVWGMR